MSTVVAEHCHCRLDSPLGGITLARSAAGLTGLWFDGQRHAPGQDILGLQTGTHEDALLQETAEQLQAYWVGRLQRFQVPLDLGAGSPFQQSVWRALLGIAYGQVSSYGAIARQLCNPRAVRAVGAAVGRNPLGIIVPCHRVLGSGGALTGYAGGLWRKQGLLHHEGHGLH